MRENRAPAILIVTHADLGEALLRAAEMIVGHQDGVSALSLWEGESLEAFQVRFQKAVAALDQRNGVLVLLDLFGGTPANAAALLLADRKFECVAGISLPMLLEVLLQSHHLSLPELASVALQAGAAGAVDVRKALEERTGKRER